MLPSILLLDDEPEVLKALERALRKDYLVHAFTDAEAALAFFKDAPTQLVISDMKMPLISGAEFLSQIVQINSRCKRVVLTGYADTKLAQQAINDGHVSAYLNKPWVNEELRETLAGLITELKQENKKYSVIKKLKFDHKRLSADHISLSLTSEFIQDERDNAVLQQKKLKLINNELLQLSANLVAMQTRDTSGHTFRIAQQGKTLAKRLKLSEVECMQIYLAGLFYRVGIHSLPPALVERPWFQMSQHERNAWMKYPQASADIISTTDILKSSAEIVLHIFEHIDGSGMPAQLVADKIPLGSRLLSIVIYYDLLISGEITGNNINPTEALIIMSNEVDIVFDKTIFRQFKQLLEMPKANEALEIAKGTGELIPGMILSQDVVNYGQHKLLSEGTVLTANNILGLSKHQEQTDQVIIVYIMHEKNNLLK
jgi:response regulator RpfG family c-di-GMP phosphodiesterase